MAFFGVMFPGGAGGGSSAWEDKVWQMLAEACATQADRNSMSYGAGEPFADATDLTLTNAVVESGYVRNTVTAGTPGGNILPMMTGYTTSGVTITTNTEFSTGYPAWKVADRAGNINGWLGGAGVNNAWVCFQLAAATSVVGFTVTAASGVYGYPTDFKLQGSANAAFTTPIDLYTATGLSWTAYEKKTFNLSATATYRYFRVILTNISAGAYQEVCEIELLGVGSAGSVNAATITLAPITVSNAAAAGKIIFTGYNADASAILDVGTNVHVYPLLDGVQGSELTFTSKSLGSNKWRFTSENEIDLTGKSTFGLRITNTTSRNMRIYEAIIVWR